MNKKYSSFNIFIFHALSGLFFLLIITSCEDFFISEVNNVNIPGSESQLVVYSYISPQDTIIRVWVYRSRPYTQVPSEFVPVEGNALVQMRQKGGESITLEYEQNRGYFYGSPLNLPIIAGKYYQLEVSTPEGDNINAECFVPEMEISDFTFFDPHLQIDNDGYPNRILEWRITGLNDKKDRFYRTGGFARSRMLFPNQTGGTDTSSVDIHPIWIERGNPYFKDEGVATTHRFRGELFADTYYYVDPNIGAPDDSGFSNIRRIDSIFITVIQSDIHYFRFHTSMDNYYTYGDDFPFAEPVHIYTNIRGGLGTFGGYNEETRWVYTDVLP